MSRAAWRGAGFSTRVIDGGEPDGRHSLAYRAPDPDTEDRTLLTGVCYAMSPSLRAERTARRPAY